MSTRASIETILRQYGVAICERPGTALAEAMAAIDALGSAKPNATELKRLRRFSPHHAITAPLGIMRHDEQGEYVLYADICARECVFVDDIKVLADVIRDTVISGDEPRAWYRHLREARALVAQWEKEQQCKF